MMGNALTILAGKGVKCRLTCDGRFNLTPTKMVTEEVKAFVKKNRDLILELLMDQAYLPQPRE